jgi:F-type H+-transporting ATPase subunit epsilon
MRLRVTTPTSVVTDAQGITHVRAEDATGAFGLLPGHTEFVTVLAISVLSYRDSTGGERHVAVRGGVLRMSDGATVEVATREAIANDDLDALHRAVLARFRTHAEAEAKARTRATQLNVALVRNLYRYVRAERDGRLLPLLGPTAPEQRK